MKKKILLILFAMLLCTILSSCGIPKPPENEQIIQDLPEEITTIIIENPFDLTNADVYEMEVKNLLIEKRQTDGKSDLIYCIIDLENQYYHYTKYIQLNYNFYDQGGWILDQYDTYAPDEWELLTSPFGAEEVKGVLYNVPIVDSGTVTSDLTDNTIQFSFPVEETHANGAYKGTAIVICRFDGKCWQYETNTDDICFVWDVNGTWQYYNSEVDEYVYHKTITYQVDVTIDSFDQNTNIIQGTLYMQYTLTHSEVQVSLDNTDWVKVNVSNDCLELLEGRQGEYSFVRFYHDKAEASLSYFAGTVQLERQD